MGTAIIRYPARAVGLMEIEHLQHFSDTLTIVPIRRVARDACRWRSVDRNSFRSPRGVRYSQECSTPSARFNLCENCYNPVYASCRGLNPSAMRGEARLRGLYRIIYSKTISPRLSKAKSACAGYIRLFLQRPSGRPDTVINAVQATCRWSDARLSATRQRGGWRAHPRIRPGADCS